MMIDEVVQLMKENSPNYIATIDGDAPRVRPMGYIECYEGRIVFATSASSSTSRQIKANPNIEVTNTAATRDKAVRIKGKAVIITDNSIKAALVEAQPNLKRISEDLDGITIFAIGEPEATLWSYTGVTSVEM